MTAPLTVMIVAAEASGDLLGAGLAQALKRRLGSGVRFVGVGGEAMAAEGVKSPFDIAELSILGLFEGLRALPRVQWRARQTAEIARQEQPDIAILIDSWGFNLRVAHRLQEVDPELTLVKYVAPQVWASRPGRAKTLARSVDHLLSINALDAAFFEPQGLVTTFVGNPALGRPAATPDMARLRAHVGAGPDDMILMIAPGSRPSEIKQLISPFQDAAHRLKAQFPALKIVVPVALTVHDPVIASATGWPDETFLLTDPDLKRDAMGGATLALACSGTLTLELAMAARPMVVAYRVGTLTHFVLKRLITTRYITLFNIAAGEEIAPEFVQSDCTGEKLARAVGDRLSDPALRASQVARQDAALELMGRSLPDPSEVAADAILALLDKKRRAKPELARLFSSGPNA